MCQPSRSEGDERLKGWLLSNHLSFFAAKGRRADMMKSSCLVAELLEISGYEPSTSFTYAYMQRQASKVR